MQKIRNEHVESNIFSYTREGMVDIIFTNDVIKALLAPFINSPGPKAVKVIYSCFQTIDQYTKCKSDKLETASPFFKKHVSNKVRDAQQKPSTIALKEISKLAEFAQQDRLYAAQLDEIQNCTRNLIKNVYKEDQRQQPSIPSFINTINSPALLSEHITSIILRIAAQYETRDGADNSNLKTIVTLLGNIYILASSRIPKRKRVDKDGLSIEKGDFLDFVRNALNVLGHNKHLGCNRIVREYLESDKPRISFALYKSGNLLVQDLSKDS